MSYKILTSGRLGEEFANYIHEINIGLSCTYIEDPQEVKARMTEFNALAGLNFYREHDISHIKWIHSFAAGVDSVVTHPSLNKDVFITRTVGNMGRKMGEYCLAYILYFLKTIQENRYNQEKRTWLPQEQRKLLDLKILVLSTGGVGSGIARILKPLVRKVTGVNTSGRKQIEFSDIIPFHKLPDDLSEYQVVINALPLTRASTEMINKDFFGRLQKYIYFNVGRGETTNVEDMLAALENGNISKAVLDVFKKEPLPEHSELWSHPDIVITPHQSAITDIEDVKSSFLPAFEALSNKINNEYVVKISRGY